MFVKTLGNGKSNEESDKQLIHLAGFLGSAYADVFGEVVVIFDGLFN